MEQAQEGKEIATLAGGCFWCLEAVYDRMQGVESVESGYMGGQRPDPTYEAVCNGDTGHAEVVRVTFDPKVLSYHDLLEVFFVIHDPTTLNRQGNDVGSQYRSVIFYHTPAQKAEADKVVSELSREKAFATRSLPKLCRPWSSTLRSAITRSTFRTIPTSRTATTWWRRSGQIQGEVRQTDEEVGD